MHIRVMVGVCLLSLGLAAGCAQPNAISPPTVTVAATVTVTEVKTVAQVQTQIIAPPAEIKTVSTVETTTAGASATTTVTKTVTAASSAAARNSLTFNSATVAANVRRLLADSPPTGYGIAGVSDVSCPNDQPVKVGLTFLCHATIGTESKSVKITVLADTGKYRVGLPS